MKYLTITLVLAFSIDCLHAQVLAQTKQSDAVPESTAKRVVERGPSHRVWQWETFEKSPMGIVTSRVRQYTELSAGMHYQDTAGNWQESQELIESYPNGAIARQGQYQVIFANNLNSSGAIDMQTPDGKRLRSNILGLMYHDTASDEAVLIARLKDSIGELVSDNQVLYPDAFEGVKADVRYTYHKGGFEQDVILREQPVSPEEYGLNPDTTEIEVMTEFIDPPMEKILQGADKSDDVISWGQTRIVRGKAFDLNTTDDKSSRAVVVKKYVKLQGRQVLLEKVALNQIRSAVSKLPLQASASLKSPVMLAKHLDLPRQPLAKSMDKPIKLARAPFSNVGFVLDYVTVNTGLNNYTFQGDTTYYVSGWGYLDGTTTIEGGAVIKYSSNPNDGPALDIYGTLVCKTGPYRPAILTSKDDNGFGETISGSTGNPATVTNSYFLILDGSTTAINNLRFCYAQYALAPNMTGPIDVWDCQFVKCQTAIDHWLSSDIRLHNVLFAKCGSVVAFEVGTGPSLIGENITVDSANLIDTNLVYAIAIRLTNSIVTCSPSSIWATTVSTNSCAINPSGPIFMTVGGAGYYLTNSSPYRSAGISGISPQLQASLRGKTTFPPVSFHVPGVNFFTNLSLYPQAVRDTNAAVDLGYHYDPIDYIFSPIFVTNAIITLNTGTVISMYGTNGYTYGIGLSDNSQLISQGSADSLNRIIQYNTVQELPKTGWANPYYALVTHFSGTQPYSLYCRFTDWSVIAQDVPHIQFGGSYPISFRDNQFHGGQFICYGPSILLTNCLLERVFADIGPDDSNIPVLRNNLILGGMFGFWPSQTNSVILDNLFDSATIPDWLGGSGVSYVGGHNAFVTGFDQLNPTFPGDIILSNSPAYQAVKFGYYYLPTNSPLLNAGSTTANMVGLYHYTVLTNQTKEATSTVDIGYHYVAVDGSGSPIDTNGNGTPDYLEDAAGSGLMSVTLTSPTNGNYYAEPANVSLTASVTGWGVATNVSFYHEALEITKDTSLPFQYGWPVVPHGLYTLYAVAANQDGLSFTSAPVNITITNFCGSAF